MGILQASLTPYSNDLHLSNLAGIPSLAVHGSDDGNVPPRHGRSHAALISAWARNADAVTVLEIPGKDHWWDAVFHETKVMEFVNRVLDGPGRTWEEDRKDGFTMTSGNPDECGTRAGIRIVEMETPGR